MLERVSAWCTSRIVSPASTVRAGDTITSAAERLGITFSSSTRRIFSRTWNVVASFTEAEAA